MSLLLIIYLYIIKGIVSQSYLWSFLCFFRNSTIVVWAYSGKSTYGKIVNNKANPFI